MKASYKIISELSDKDIEELTALYQKEWWTKGRTAENVKFMLQNSDVVIGFRDTDDDVLIGFVRVLTDCVYKAIVFDLIIEESHRHAGLGKMLIEEVLHHPRLQKVKHFELYCLPELISFYEDLGFTDDLEGVKLLRIQRKL